MKIFRIFFHSEKSVAIVLFGCTCLAMLLANSSYLSIYQAIIHHEFSIPNLAIYQEDRISFSFQHFVNEGLMAIFFLMVGLELKREILCGELSSKKHALLPLICAASGVLFPMAIYFGFNWQSPKSMLGFAIPCATDIAFAYAIISALGNFFSYPLKVFILALAVIDDLFVILIIAMFYSKNITLLPLIGSLFCGFLLIRLNRSKVSIISPFIAIGLALWLFLSLSKINPTIAGSIVALAIPLERNGKKMAENLSGKLENWINYGILPLFAFLNCGVSLNFEGIKSFDEILLDPILLGCGLGLFFGKQFGIFLAALICKKIKLVQLPNKTSLAKFYCAVIFTGIGFTMSIFMTSLAFEAGSNFEIMAKLGVLLGSLMSVIFGLLAAFLIRLKSTKSD